MSKLFFNDMPKKELFSKFNGITRTQAEKLLSELEIDYSIDVSEVEYLTIKKTIWVQVRSVLRIQTDEYMEFFQLAETKLVKASDDIDADYVLAREGSINRIFERLGCMAETTDEPPEKKKRRKKEQEEETQNETSPEQPAEGPVDLTEAAEMVLAKAAVKETDISVTIIEPFRQETDCLTGIGKMEDDRIVEVVISKEHYGLIKRKMSINAFLQKQIPGTAMVFSGHLEDGGERPKAFLTGMRAA